MNALTNGDRIRLAALGVDPRLATGRPVNRSSTRNRVELDASVAVPDGPDKLEETLSDPAVLGKIVKNRKSLAEFMNEYRERAQGEGTELNDLVAAEVQRGMAAFLRDNEIENTKRVNLADPQANGSMVRLQANYAAGHNPAAPGAVLDNEFKTSGEYLRSIRQNRTPSDAARWDRISNEYSSVTPGDGGFLVPETLRSQLLQVALEQSVVRSRAFVVPMESARVPFPMIDETSRVGSVFGGMVAYWTEEAGQLVESSAKFGRVVLDAKKLTGYSAIPNELLNDSILSLAAFIDQKWPEALTHFEDVAFLTGSGVGEPLGMLGARNKAGIAVAKETNQEAATIVWQNIVKMYSRMLPASLGRAVWLLTPAGFVELATMGLTIGTGGSAIWINNGVAGPPATLLGRPIIITEKAATLGARGDIAFVDMGYYLVGDRQSMSAESSGHYLFGTDKTAFRIIQRVDGRPWLQSPLTPANGGPTMSPFIELAART